MLSFIVCRIALCLALVVVIVSAQECTSDGRCDQHERCAAWAQDEECIKSRAYMTKYCPASCASNEASQNIDSKRRELKGKCEDLHEHCPDWAALGECEENKADMNKYCALSCGVCSPSQEEEACTDNHASCSMWAGVGECDNNPKYMHANCAKSCNTCEKVGTVIEDVVDDTVAGELQAESEEFGERQTAIGAKKYDTLQRIQASIQYMNEEKTKQLPKSLLDVCQNRNELCSFWAVLGECENNKGYMTTNCAPACRTCHLIDIEKRCPKLVDPDPALHPGDLNKMFERIVRTAPGNRTDITDDERRELQAIGMPQYTVHVHSRPSEDDVKEISAALDKSLPPWVITFDNFVTDEECDAMVQLGYKYGYKRSEDVGKRKFDGSHDSIKSEKRTSENAWCSDRDGCRSEEIPTRLHERMSVVMNIPAVNSEDFQMLKYEKGQFYRTHHDYIPHQKDRQCGPRILTFFLYLSDVEEGGGTNFPQLDITVGAKKGRALLWPSVMNSDPLAIDSRMYHQALEVIEGTKFASNGWIHMYDYTTPQKAGCT